jgi:4-amino-4-deoxy-L-arabinose transferase-like glycosyltransferase
MSFSLTGKENYLRNGKFTGMNSKSKGIDIKPAFLWIFLILFLGVVWASLSLPMVVNAAKYAQVSREILSSGDWINLTIAGDAYEQKPPLLFWIGAVFFNVFGISTSVWKIAVYLVSILGIWSTYRLGKLISGKETGILSAVFWASSLSFLYYHNDIHTDTLLADMVIFAIWQLASFFREGKKSGFYLGIIGVGLAMLSKGPVGMAIPAMAVGLDLLLHRKWKEIFHPRWLLAALMIAIMIFPALLGLYRQFGSEGIEFYFWTNNMGRITGSYYVQNPDPAFYLHTTLYMLAPFTIFALFGLYMKFRDIILSRWKFAPSEEFFTIGGIIPYMLILSVSKTKNPHYLMAVVPLFMILAARFVQRLATEPTWKKTQKTVSWLNLLVQILIWTLIGLFVFWFFPEKNVWYWMIIILFTGLIVYSFLKYKGINRQVVTLTITQLMLMFSLFFSFYPKMSVYHAPFQVAADFNKMAGPTEQIHLYLKPSRYWEIFFYSSHPGKYFVTSEDLPKLIEAKKDWVFTDTEGKNQILNILPGTKIIGEYNHRSLSQMTFPVLNPATRASKLEKRYLLHLP